MALTPGTRLGPYDVTALIGEGGMGQVYRAHDTELDRDVALKILPDAFTSDPDRLARFQREAKTLAALNHPNIAQIYGVERSDGVQALAMEFVDGEDLAERLARGPIPLDDALPIAKQIAEALEAAHEQGVVHRDLKPANIKLRTDGTVKVLDFGLAKAMTIESGVGSREPGVGNALANSPTITSPVGTMPGVILGTAAYMSPEQARGKPVDKRTDIWAFGCVLYEMLTGRRAFPGEDLTETLAAVVKSEPDWTALPATTPPAVRRLLRRCLTKDSARRLSDMNDARLDLDDGQAEMDPPADVSLNGAIPSFAWWQRPVPMTLAAAALALVTGGVAWNLARVVPGPLPAVMRFAVALPAGDRFSGAPQRQLVALSPDGTTLVYAANDRLYLRRLGEDAAAPIRGTEPQEGNASARDPFFSPDGAWIGYTAGEQLWKVAVDGGTPVAVARIDDEAFGPSWGPDDRILYSSPDGIWRVAAGGGSPERVIAARDGEMIHGPRLLPDGRTVLYTAGTGVDWSEADIVGESLDGGQRTVLIEGGRDAWYLPTGHLVYARGSTLLAVRFDPSTRRVSGGPVSLLDELGQVSMGLVRSSGSAFFAVSRTGTLAYVPAASLVRANKGLAWVDRTGNAEPLPLDPKPFQWVRISPDFRRAALGYQLGPTDADVWTYDLERRLSSRLTSDDAWEGYPVWTRDGASLVYSSSRDGGSILQQSASGTGRAEQLISRPTMAGISATSPLFPYAVSPEGRLTLYFSTNANGMDLFTMPLEAGGQVTPLVQTRFYEHMPALSPDGRWLAYRSNESGRYEVYVRPFPDVEASKQQISRAGGDRPEWAPNGRELFYVEGDALMRVPVTTSPRFEAGTPMKLFESRGRFFLEGRYGVSRDGKRFLILTNSPDDDQVAQRPEIRVVLNWTEELKAKVP